MKDNFMKPYIMRNGGWVTIPTNYRFVGKSISTNFSIVHVRTPRSALPSYITVVIWHIILLGKVVFRTHFRD